METLSKKYVDQLKRITTGIQVSDELKRFLEEEEEDDFKALKEKFEPEILELYAEVAAENPYMLFDLEEKMLVPELEGLFIPQLIAATVLRAEVTPDFLFARPQKQFAKIVQFATDSSNFDYFRVSSRLGMIAGCALSSRIWVENLASRVRSPKVR